MHAWRAGHGTGFGQIRQYHQRLVLQRLRHLGEASKADLARAADLTNTAVGQIVRDLEFMGLVETVGKRHGGQRGQPATMLRLNPAGAFAIGVRLDRSRIETVLADLGGRLIAQRVHDLDLPPPDHALDIIRRDVEGLLALCRPEQRRRLAGVGIGRPYDLGAWLKELDLAEARPALAEWDRVDVAAEVARVTGLTTFEENDGTAAAIAELFYGHGREIEDFLYLFIGPSIGGGVVVGGNYLRGPSGNAGDVGVMPVAASKLPSAPRPAGPREILLTRASVNALVRHLRQRGSAVHSLGSLPGVMAENRPAVLEWIEDCADALVGPILSMQALLDVSTVVIDSDLDKEWIERLMERTAVLLRHSVAEARTPPRLTRGSFGPDAGALGAASLPLFVHFGPNAGSMAGEAHGPRGGFDHAVAS